MSGSPSMGAVSGGAGSGPAQHTASRKSAVGFLPFTVSLTCEIVQASKKKTCTKSPA